VDGRREGASCYTLHSRTLKTMGLVDSLACETCRSLAGTSTILFLLLLRMLAVCYISRCVPSPVSHVILYLAVSPLMSEMSVMFIELIISVFCSLAFQELSVHPTTIVKAFKTVLFSFY